MHPSKLLTSKFVDLYDGPVLVIDRSQIIENVNRFRAAMPNVAINYAVKANPNHDVLVTLIDQGVNFDVASIAEVEMIHKANRVSHRELDTFFTVYSNPIRSDTALNAAISKGISWYVVDNLEGMKRLHSLYPQAKMYIRMIVSNENSEFPLTGKFGATFEQCKEMVKFARDHFVDLRGVSFHVGSQCSNIQNWVNGIRQAKDVYQVMVEHQLTPSFLNLGGGYPVQHTKPIASIEEIGAAINEEIKDLNDIRIIAEPGRFIISNAAHMLCQVVATANRDKKWVYLDVGVFHGMTEAAAGDGFKYNYLTKYDVENPTAEKVSCVMAGPTCDSLDIITKDQEFPADLSVSDFIIVQNCGSYTTTYGTEFNGFPAPKSIVV